MYEYCEDETIALCGDYNARVGGRPDFIDGVDEVPPRVNIDTFVNDHGCHYQISVCSPTHA